jgi:hypothetical protein
MMTENTKLLGRDACIDAIFSPDARPSPRTFEAWKKRKIIPYVKLGGLCYYSETAVRAAVARFSINTRAAA